MECILDGAYIGAGGRTLLIPRGRRTRRTYKSLIPGLYPGYHDGHGKERLEKANFDSGVCIHGLDFLHLGIGYWKGIYLPALTTKGARNRYWVVYLFYFYLLLIRLITSPFIYLQSTGLLLS